MSSHKMQNVPCMYSLQTSDGIYLCQKRGNYIHYGESLLPECPHPFDWVWIEEEKGWGKWAGSYGCVSNKVPLDQSIRVVKLDNYWKDHFDLIEIPLELFL